MQIWAEPRRSALPICNYSQILYQFLTFTQNLKRSLTISYNISGKFIIGLCKCKETAALKIKAAASRMGVSKGLLYDGFFSFAVVWQLI